MPLLPEQPGPSSLSGFDLAASKLHRAFSDEPVELLLLCAAAGSCTLAWALSGHVRRSANKDGVARSGPVSPSTRDEMTYRRLRNRYLGAYTLATFGDWIQGGYLYALYAGYGYSIDEIALLFVVGYGSAATLGGLWSARSAPIDANAGVQGGPMPRIRQHACVFLVPKLFRYFDIHFQWYMVLVLV